MTGLLEQTEWEGRIYSGGFTEGSGGTGNPALGLALARRLHTVMIHITGQTIAEEPNAPLGGVGASGNGGRFGSTAEWDEFTQWQWVTVRDTPKPYPF
jgi:benzaldehyde dehydrogenase (NAD)